MKTLRCVHCLKPLQAKTKDHVFPRSWYPETTPENIQRWTAPSCAACNGKFGEMEKELFIRLALCIDPHKVEAAGLSKKAVESMGIGVPNISSKEREHRQALKSKILKEMKPYVPGTPYFPGLGPHAGFPEDQQHEIRIPEALLKEVATKIVRGCEYVLGGRRLIEEPYTLQIYFAHDAKVPDIIGLFGRFGPEQLGPGFSVRRAAAHDDPNAVLYKIDVWEKWTIYASILPN